MPGISLLNNFSFEENGIRAWRAFNVGPGRLLSYSELEELYRDIEQTISHLIQIETVTVCELPCAEKLSLLKLAQLREVCRALRLQTNGSNSRKRTFTEPLDA